jgi:hypothetical protein
MSMTRGGKRAQLSGAPIEGGSARRDPHDPLDSAATDMRACIPEMLGRAGRRVVFTISSRVVDRTCNSSLAAALTPADRTGPSE